MRARSVREEEEALPVAHEGVTSAGGMPAQRRAVTDKHDKSIVAGSFQHPIVELKDISLYFIGTHGLKVSSSSLQFRTDVR